MGFKRNWDTSCPRVWREWEDNGQKFVIQDLAPEDDGRALDILVAHMCTDEVLCSLSNLIEDAESVAGVKEVWMECLKKRTSLGCYTLVDGKNTLVALSVCTVDSVDDGQPTMEIKGEAWQNVFNAMAYLEERCNTYEYLGVDKLLHGFGLVVSKQFRGAGIGSKLLDSREELCRAIGVQATATVFSGPASQKSAAKIGFTTIFTVSLRDFADSGLRFPRDEKRVVKLMVKKYV